MKALSLICDQTGQRQLALTGSETRLLSRLDFQDLGAFLDAIPEDQSIEQSWASLEVAYERSSDKLSPDSAGVGQKRYHDGSGRLWTLVAPIRKPPKIAAVGLNYRGHALEQGKEPPANPMFFSKARNCVIADQEAIELPPGHTEIDVEVELVVVIGRSCFEVTPQQAPDYIFGYTIGNDVTDRKAQRDDKQFYRGKSFATFAPLGPWVVRAQDFPIEAQSVQLWRNGQLQQISTLDRLIFKIPDLVSRLSQVYQLEPGELLFSGTPEGVGAHRKPPVFLGAGDIIRCSIEGLDVLENPVMERPTTR
jgi:2-keto-4-pentenoate hydratase/2-oxohepta-3-ene-1,7-dioic acid hydratase in catechol pathway